MSMLRGCRLSSPWLWYRCAGRRVDLGGPSKGIFAVGKAGYLPPSSRRPTPTAYRKHSADPRPCRNLAQPAVRCDAFRTEFLPNPVTAHRIVLPHHVSVDVQRRHLSALQYEKAPRPFRIGSKGNGLMWLIGGLGFCGSLLAFVLSFIPPSQIAVGSNTVWFAVLIIGCIVVVAAPFIIYASRKPSWVDKGYTVRNRSTGKNRPQRHRQRLRFPARLKVPLQAPLQTLPPDRPLKAPRPGATQITPLTGWPIPFITGNSGSLKSKKHVFQEAGIAVFHKPGWFPLPIISCKS